MRDYDAIKEALTFYAATAETTRKTRALLDAADAIEELVARVTDFDVGNKSRTKKATEPWEETIDGIKCTVERKVYHDVLDVYTFTVPGWPECSVSGRRAARRTIRGRLDFAVRNTLGIDDPPKEVE